MKFNILSIVAIIICLSACHRSNPGNDSPQAITLEHITYADTIDFANGTGYAWDIDVALPNQGIDPITDTIRLHLINLLFRFEEECTCSLDAQEEMLQYIKYFQEQAQCSDEEPDFEFYHEQTIRLTLLNTTDTTLTFREENSIYSGGAHGSFAFTYHVFDRRSGRLLCDEDLWRNGTQHQVDSLLLLALQQYIQVEDLQLDDFWLENLHSNSNFYLANDSIHYTFNIYEIAPYCFGAHTLAIPMFAAQPFLK